MIELEEKHQPPELNSEGAFHHGKDPVVVFSRHPGLFMLMNSPVHSFLSECPKLLILASP